MPEITRIECDTCGKQVDIEDGDGWLSVGTVQARRGTEFKHYVHGVVCSLVCLRLFAALAKPVEIGESHSLVRNDGGADLMERLQARESELRAVKPPGQYL